MIRLGCLFGYHEYDLWVAGWVGALIDHIKNEAKKEWGWVKVNYDSFGLAYYCECKHCGKVL